MKLDLSKLNAHSTTSIHFYNSKFSFEQITDMFNLLFAKNGIFYIYKTTFATIISPFIGQIPWANSSLLNFPSPYMIYPHCPKPSITAAAEMLEQFKEIALLCKYELVLNLYYDTIDQKYIIDTPNQIVSPVLAEGEYSEYEYDTRYIRYSQVHSHHSMSADFSKIDDEDEKNSISCFFGVMGKIPGSTIMTCDKKFRVWNGFDRFMPVLIDNIFDCLYTIPKLSDEKLEQLRDIADLSLLEESKKNQNKSAKNIAPASTSAYPWPAVNNKSRSLTVQDLIDSEEYDLAFGE